jgi:RhtB (resistance to homoserine/threonine) family protein
MELGKFFTLFLISLLGAISPGPDFAIVTKNCISGNFRRGCLTALGVAAAIAVHVSYAIFGIAIIIMETPFLFHAIKYVGAAYLFYLGILLVREKAPSKVVKKVPDMVPQRKLNNPFISGFLCNLLNPKATLFIISLFSQFIVPSSAFYEKLALGCVVVFVTGLWFIFLSFLITHHRVQKHFHRFQFTITKIMGFVLCGVSLYVVLFS